MKTLREKIVRILELSEQGDFSRTDVLVFVGMGLVEEGSAEDVALLPEWLRKDLIDWVVEFDESPLRTKQLISSNGVRDITNEMRKLSTLIAEYRSQYGA